MAIIDYEFAVRMGLQGSIEEVGEYGVQLNRAFGAGDTLIYLPLILISLIGLIGKKLVTGYYRRCNGNLRLLGLDGCIHVLVS